jgi:hypothetical protein
MECQKEMACELMQGDCTGKPELLYEIETWLNNDVS